MRRTLGCALLLLLTFHPGAARQTKGSPQQVLTFKGAHLGMSLADFRALNNATVRVPHRQFGPFKLKRSTVQLPMCSDSADQPQQPTSQQPTSKPDAIVICLTSSAEINPEGRTVAGVAAESLVYRFFRDQLYQIEAEFDPIAYATMREAFVGRYGNPAEVQSEDLHNAYGIAVKSEVLIWREGDDEFVLRQGAADLGPLVNPVNTTAVWRDTKKEALVRQLNLKPRDF
jgi:hypothetical protein